MSEPMTASQWRTYYDAMANTPPRDTLLFALSRFDAENRFAGTAPLAIDLGCGEGRDTVELLRRGWQVLAIDGQEEGIRRLRDRPDLPLNPRLETQVSRYEDTRLPENAARLLNASFSLPFCSPDYFPILWQQILLSLVPGGRFSGQLFGDRDGWAGRPGMTHHTCAEAETLLAPLVIERFDEEERDGTTVTGAFKHWHIFHIVARKP
jgi:SAM-dependent methyltransferase